jgi:SAM-dependent methyltransferase
VTRTDTQSSEPAVRPFVRASVLDLPFRDGAWDAVTCVDVIEHLCEPDRERALAELVRVSRRLLVVAFPSGPAARSADERMNAAYAAAGRSAPDWVLEHLRNTYPEPGFLDRLVPKLAGNRPFQEQRVFNESLALQRSHRFLSVRFTAAYKVWTLACGLLLPLLARPLPARSAYRCIGVVRFGDPGEPA